MPRSYARRKVIRRRRYGRKRKNTIKKMVNRALRSQLEVKKWLSGNTEVTVNTLAEGASTNWVTPMVSVPQGTASYQRVGNRIKVLGLQIKNFFNNNATTSQWLRFVVLRLIDRTALTTTSAIFSGTNNQQTDFGTVSGMNSMMRPFHPTAVKPVYDKVFKVTANSSEAAGSFKKLNKFIKFPRGLTVEFNQASTGIATTSPTYVFGVWAAEAPEDVGAGTVVEWSYQYTVFYTDA